MLKSLAEMWTLNGIDSLIHLTSTELRFLNILPPQVLPVQEIGINHWTVSYKSIAAQCHRRLVLEVLLSSEPVVLSLGTGHPWSQLLQLSSHPRVLWPNRWIHIHIISSPLHSWKMTSKVANPIKYYSKWKTVG